MTEQRPPRVFISYSHDTIAHQERVLGFADRLRNDGIDAEIDQYNAAPPEGWPLWCERQIAAADVVLMVCTETYHGRVSGDEKQSKGLGVVWEARIIRQLLYDAGAVSDKFVPVLFSDTSPEQIPTPIKGWTRYVVDTEDGYEELYRRLTGQPRLLRPALGTIRPMPTRRRQWSEGTMQAVSSRAETRITVAAAHGGMAAGRDQTFNYAPPPAGVHFTVYHPKEIKPEVWCTLLGYVHIREMQSTVEADAKQRLEVPHGRRIAEATHSILRGAEIVVAPELPGCRFNPPSARLLWLEDWHRVEFRLQAQPELAGFELGKAVNGRIAFYVESVLVGEVPIWTCISDEADTTAADAPTSTASAEPYETIFVSYAHEDSAVVSRLGRAYKALGMEFLRDVEKLRSGEQWNPALLAMIERANIFQLYWSRAAKHSRYVKQEWNHALKQERTHFIRPLYWQLPMPQPPRKLAQLNFSYIELDN